jgi:hypothetical protein
MRPYLLSNGEEAAVQCGSAAFQLIAMMLFIASITGCRWHWMIREASVKL